MTVLRDITGNRALLTFMLGHFTVDMYGGLLPVLYPLMALEFDLSNSDVGLIALAFTAASSLSQPAFGYIVDRFGSRLLAPASLAWAAVMFGLAGLSPSSGFLVIATFLAGLGSGAYHPLGASNAARVTADARKNTAMSVYTVGGTSGYALGPLLGAVVFGLLGRQGSVLMIPIGIASAVLVARSLRRLNLGRPVAAPVVAQAGEPTGIRWRPLLPVLAVVMLRSWAFLSVVTFIPLRFQDLGYGAAFYGPLTTVVIGCGAVGTIVGGMVADRIGERRVLVGTLIACIPALLLFAAFPGPGAFAIGALLGFLADGSLSVTLVMAQRLLPGRAGLASGFILGMGFVTGGIGVPITGAIADRVGMAAAWSMLTVLLLAAVVAALRIPAAALRREAAAGPAADPPLAPADD